MWAREVAFRFLLCDMIFMNDFSEKYRRHSDINEYTISGNVIGIEYFDNGNSIKLSLSHRWHDAEDKRLDCSISVYGSHASNLSVKKGDNILCRGGLRFGVDGRSNYIAVSHPKQHWIKKIVK